MGEEQAPSKPEVSPTGKAVVALPPAVNAAAAAICAAAGVVITLEGIPPWLRVACSIVLAVGVALGIMSPGLRR